MLNIFCSTGLWLLESGPSLKGQCCNIKCLIFRISYISCCHYQSFFNYLIKIDQVTLMAYFWSMDLLKIWPNFKQVHWPEVDHQSDLVNFNFITCTLLHVVAFGWLIPSKLWSNRYRYDSCSQSKFERLGWNQPTKSNYMLRNFNR